MILEPWYENLREQTVETTAPGGGWWRISDLLDAVKDEPEVEIPLDHLNFGNESDLWNMKCIYDFAQHMKLVMDANVDYPIILDHRGVILDGRHRMVKALLEGRTTIMPRATTTFQSARSLSAPNSLPAST
jgi:hypothetical protein